MPNGELPLDHKTTPVTIGRYGVVCKLGVGGMADVFLAHQPGPFSASKLVVIKQIRPGVLTDEHFIHMFADESRIAVRLNHPNVVHTYEVVAENDEYFLTLEFLDGKSLYQVLNRVTRAGMPLALHVWVLTQVLSGLQYAHELKDFDGSPLGIVHRDVSPSNVFVTYSGRVKLLDFGIAKSASAIASTRDGIIKGKLGYAAPEQCLSEAIDGRTDVFAVGVMLWEAIAGRRRPTGETDAGTYRARVQGTEISIAEACPDAPRDLIEACDRALARLPEQRFASALEFRQALDKYLRDFEWEVGEDQLREFMHEHFAPDISEMRQRIDEHIAGLRPPELDHRSWRPGPPESTSASGPSGPASGVGQLTRLGPSESGDSSVKSRFGHPLTLAIGVLGGLAIGAISWRFVIADGKEAGDSREHAALSASSPGATPAAPPGGAVQPMGQVTVNLVAIPNTAELFLDGRRISNPYRAAHGRDNAPHHLTASLGQRQSIERELVFTQDIDLTLDLLWQEPERAGKLAASGAHEPAKVSKAAPAVKRGISANATGAASAALAPAQPGEDLRPLKSRVNNRDIDETDPYKR